MKRDLDTIQNTQFDLLVIGGGIQGAAICFKAAQRGLRVLLLEKNDFCGASSANSLKILHGGLRYLQTLDFRRMRDSIRSRRELMQLAPHLVAPLSCVMPAYGHGLKGREVMLVAMAMNDLISMDRNAGLAEDKRLPMGYTINKAKCLERIPGITEQSLHGASIWYDALALNTERLALEYILQAAEMGASCVNYASVSNLSPQSDGGIQAQLIDAQSGKNFSVQSSYVINSAGAAYEDLIPQTPSTHVRWARGLNIVIKKNLFPLGAVALEKKMDAQKRMLFMVPWREKYTMIGTHYVEMPRVEMPRVEMPGVEMPGVQTPRSKQLFPVEKKDIMALVDEVNVIYPPAKLKFEYVSFYHAGLLPIDESAEPQNEPHTSAKYATAPPPALSKESTIIDHGQAHGFSGFFSIRGIKYTTAPQVADKVLKMIFGAAEDNVGTSTGGHVDAAIVAEDGEIEASLLQKYAGRAKRVNDYVATAPQWLDDDQSLSTGEVQYFIHEEMATHLSDVVFRRSCLGTAECPPLAVLEKINQIMADHFKWSEQQQAAELQQVLGRYAPLQIPH